MLDGAKAFFFMIGDESDSPVLRYLDQTDARVVAARPDPEHEHRLAALDRSAHRIDAAFCKAAVWRMKPRERTGGAHQRIGQSEGEFAR